MPAAAMSQPVIHRFFFALRPDDITARRTHAFAEAELGSKGLLQPERHHVTLALTEDLETIPGVLVDRLLRAGAAVRAAPFAFTLDRLSVGYGVVVLRPARIVRALRDLQAGIAHAMSDEGVGMRPGWSFQPHQTVSYRKAEQPTERAIPGFQWNATEFVLVHSYVGLHRHEIIGRWPLQAAEERQGTLL